jgi:hypothetical protein
MSAVFGFFSFRELEWIFRCKIYQCFLERKNLVVHEGRLSRHTRNIAENVLKCLKVMDP